MERLKDRPTRDFASEQESQLRVEAAHHRGRVEALGFGIEWPSDKESNGDGLGERDLYKREERIDERKKTDDDLTRVIDGGGCESGDAERAMAHQLKARTDGEPESVDGIVRTSEKDEALDFINGQVAPFTERRMDACLSKERLAVDSTLFEYIEEGLVVARRNKCEIRSDHRGSREHIRSSPEWVSPWFGVGWSET